MPLSYYSADGLLVFGGRVDEAEAHMNYEEFYRYWDQRPERFEALGFKKFDKKNALGHIRLAALNLEESELESCSHDEVVNYIAKFQKMQAVRVRFAGDRRKLEDPLPTQSV